MQLKKTKMKISFPSTRFLGSKLKLLDWIWDNIKHLDFDTVLDAFGGTGSVSYLLKKKGKTVFYNDFLNFNKQIGLALIENNSTILSENDIIKIITKDPSIRYPKFITKTFDGMYYTKEENQWLDKTIVNINNIQNKYKRAIAMSALFQACLVKRPYNLFHRNNLSIRTKDVPRTFGNKVTWETSFLAHYVKFVDEYNKAVFNNGMKNKVLGGKDVFKLPSDVDLVYLDPPYLSEKSRINYRAFYHFLEGISNYSKWDEKIDNTSSLKSLKKHKNIEKWLDRKEIINLFDKMIEKFKNNKIVISYRDDGIPSKKEIVDIIIKHKKKRPIVKSIDYKYALSNGSTKELLFIVD